MKGKKATMMLHKTSKTNNSGDTNQHHPRQHTSFRMGLRTLQQVPDRSSGDSTLDDTGDRVAPNFDATHVPWWFVPKPKSGNLGTAIKKR